MRAPLDTIPAPPFPPGLEWVNARGPQAPLQRGRPMLVEFWDFCRPNSIRTLPYLKAWHERYGPAGLRTIGVHSPGFEPSREGHAVRAAVARLGIPYPVLIDTELELWRAYGNEGWPARYLFDGHARLFEYHRGEGAYEETERAIQELTGVAREPLEPMRPEDVPGARLRAQSADRAGAYSGPFEAGGVWAVLSGSGALRASDGRGEGFVELALDQPGAYPLFEYEHHASGVLEIELHGRLECLATCFTPGLA